MTSEPGAPGAAAVILYMEVDRDDNVSRESRYTQIKILTEEGRSHADIQITFDRRRESLTDIEARTIRTDGTVIPYTGEIFEQPVASGSDTKLIAKTLVLTDVEVGSVIEYRYSRRDRNGGMYSTRWLLANNLFTREALYRFRGGQPFRYSTPKGLPPGTEPVSNARRGYLELRTHNVAAYVPEEYSPPSMENQYRLDLIYAWDWDRVESDPDKFWKRYAKEQRSTTNEFLLGSGALRTVVNELAPPGEAPEARLRKLYEACAGVRNKSYEPMLSEEEEKREDEASPRNVRDLWSKQYGWATQINLLFLAMAREAGFDAAEIWVADRREAFYASNQMDPGPLDLLLVGVKLDGQEHYLAPGLRFLPFGMLPWGRTAMPALRIDKSSHTWITIPPLKPAQSRIKRAAELTLMPDGALRGTVTAIHTGQEALWRRYQGLNEDAAHRREFLENNLLQTMAQSAVVKVTADPDWDGTGDFIVEYQLSIPQYAMRAGSRRMLPLALFASGSNKAFQRAERVHPLYFPYPYETDEQVQIELPAGWKLEKLPEGDLSDLKNLVYSIDVLRLGAGDAVLVRRKFRSNLLILQPDAYDIVRSFYQTVRAADEQQIVVTAGAN